MCVYDGDLVVRWPDRSEVPFANDIAVGGLPVLDPALRFGGEVVAEAAVKAFDTLEPALLGLPQWVR